ncbi:MAG: FAD-binding protein [Acidobacteria bacterium]|nr:FAD-binding protein [Acidobacteriota bacterium]NIM61737.1 FAD-binding protein [Acidobacteriota bacterium]NIO58917.1 FAD-binding protein [Acidobacteriota bacterium]NIQ29971.1 FAD-binding protein [Acidobacteriota bacterium]NIQ84704.1 FAD-binding protein [Acidobacteriota bacterium]
MDLATQLASILPAQRVSTRYLDRVACANDASVYRLIPRAVVYPNTVEEVRGLLAVSRRERIPMTFRAAGTSLSGQALTDGILVVLSRGWRDYEVLDEGARIRFQPGVIGGIANQALRPHGRKIGPDPASINACMMGGILANNSSGMCCGIEQNAYRTLDSMVLVLPDGTTLDTADPDATGALRAEAPEILDGLVALRDRVRRDRELVRLIRHKYRMKNTMGYSLNAFVDFDDPIDILAHLMIGAEGTLGFIAEAVLNTVPDYGFKYTGLLFFDDVPAACSAIEPLRRSGARALELMDYPSLRAVRSQPGVPQRVGRLPEGTSALLVEYQCDREDERDAFRREAERLLPGLPLAGDPEWTVDPERQAKLWRVRKGLIPSVGATRAQGTAFINEDVVFPVERLASGVAELQDSFRRWDYDDAIVFGHAKDGNLHFVLTQPFRNEDDVRRYDTFMRELADLVAVRYDGALKAEHGTGRNMAPFVETEWGGPAVRVMRELKRLIDPDGLLNPGVILNDNPAAHVTDLKDLPEVEPEVDRCIECGFCERWCPSRDLTLTPRQRIVVRRQMRRLHERDPSDPALAELQAGWRFAAEDTCATDGLCALACPVAIDTGRLTKRLRRARVDDGDERFSLWVVERFGWCVTAARTALRLGHLLSRVIGSERHERWSRRVAPRGLHWIHPMPPLPGRPARRRPDNVDAVFFPSCVSRVFGEPGDDSPPGRTVERVAARAGLSVWTPRDAHDVCCGMPFSSKGLDAAYRAAAHRTLDALWRWTDGGRVPVLTDASPCAWTLKEIGPVLTHESKRKFERLTILDGIEFAHDVLLDRLELTPLRHEVAVHPVCSVRKMGLETKLVELAGACSGGAAVPSSSACCGMAGDRGFLVPELPEAALQPLRQEIEAGGYFEFFSSSRSCEAGLTRVTGKPYRSFWRLLDDATDRSRMV